MFQLVATMVASAALFSRSISDIRTDCDKLVKTAEISKKRKIFKLIDALT